MYAIHKGKHSTSKKMSIEDDMELNENSAEHGFSVGNGTPSHPLFFSSKSEPVFKPYKSINGDDLLKKFRGFPSGNSTKDESVAQEMFLALATAPSIDLILNYETINDIERMQQILEGGALDKFIDWYGLPTRINNSYAEAVRQVLSIPINLFDGRPLRFSLEKPVISNEEHLIGYEIEMGANFRARELPPHFVLAETTLALNLGWPALSFQVDRMPGRAPQIELVTGPLDRETRKSADYYHAIAAAKRHISGSNKFEDFMNKYNAEVGEKFHIDFSSDALSFLSAGGDLSYDLALPGKPELIARNVQTTVQIPYSALGKEHPTLDRIFSNDSELKNILIETRKMVDKLLLEKELLSLDSSTKNARSVFVHAFFELLANLAVGRNEYSDFKSRAPLIFRTSPEVIAPYICSPQDRKQLKTIFLNRELLVKWVIQTLNTHANNGKSQKFLEIAGSIEVKRLIFSKLTLIEQRLEIAEKSDRNYLVAHSGSVPGVNGIISWIRPEMRQTLCLPPTVHDGELHIAVELRNRPAFSAFHRSYAGVAPIG